MMKLTASKASPFVRKVLLTIALKDLTSKVEQVEDVDRKVRSHNPLHKIPTLLLEDGEAVQDSHVICEYLDMLTPDPRLFPSDARKRVKTLTLASLGDGIMEAALLVMFESRFRPADKWVQSWVDRQQNKIDAAVDWLENNIPVIGDHPDYGHLTIACALGYLDFRLKGAWRDGHPNLVKWLDSFAGRVPAFGQSAPEDGRSKKLERLSDLSWNDAL